jgi:membrane protease subunit HflC
MVTAEQKNITIDTTARWRIEDPLTFYESFGNEQRAQSRLDDVLHEQVQTTIASTDLTEIVRSKSWEIEEEDLKQVVRPEGEGKQLEQEVRTGRAELAEKMRQQAAKALDEFGITLLDLRIKRINYVDQVQQRVFQRMISERQRIATKFRQEGKEQAQRIRAEADREVAEIKAAAEREGEVIRGQADAEATSIYNAAFGQDPDFYAFMRTLESYNTALGKDSVLMLSTDSAYFRYLRRLQPETAEPETDGPPTAADATSDGS